jgi:hypothetical protein
MNIPLSVLVYKADIIIISSNITCSFHAIAEPLGHSVINNKNSVTHSSVRISSVNNSLGKCGRKQTTNDNGIIAYLQTDSMTMIAMF